MPSAATRPRRNQRGPHVFKRGNVWYAYSPEKGDGVSLRTRDPIEAQRRFADFLAGKRVDGGDAGGLQREVQVHKIADLWLSAPHGYTPTTLRSATKRASAWVNWLAARGVTLPSEITHGILDAWLSERAPKVSRRTINRDLRVLRVMLRWAVSRGHCAASEVVSEHRGMREADWTTRTTVPSPDEMRAILEVLQTRHRTTAAAARVMYAAGLRVGELLRLTADDLRDGAVWVRPERGPAATAAPTKGYRERAIPLAPEAVQLVTAYLERVRTRGAPPSSRTIHRQVTQASKLAGVEPACGVHDLRRAAATEWARAGVPLTVVSRWLGHRLMRTTERYLSTYRADAAAAAPVPAALLPAARSDNPGPVGKLSETGGAEGVSLSENGSTERRRRVRKAP